MNKKNSKSYLLSFRILSLIAITILLIGKSNDFLMGFIAGGFIVVAIEQLKGYIQTQLNLHGRFKK